jgi:parallel beta-helix repeat protein
MRTKIAAMRNRSFVLALTGSLFTLLLLMTCSAKLFAQSASYNVSYATNVSAYPGSLNTETDATTTGWTNIGGTTGPISADVWSSTVTIPFAFDFFGSPVTAFKVNQGGVLTFTTGAVALPGGNTALPAAGLPDLSIALMWDDFTNTAPTGSGDQVYYKVFGTAPNRQLWIKYFSFEMGNPSLSFVYTAAVLEETTNNVYIVDMYNLSNTGTTTVGLQYSSSFAVQDIASPNIPHGATGTAITDSDVWTFIPFSLSACTTPPTPGTATAIPSSGICPTSLVSLSLTGNSAGLGQTYQWQSSANIGGPYTNEGGSQSGASLIIGATSTRYYRCEVTCSGNSQFSTPVLVTVNAAFPGGNYTINSAITTGGSNFQTFNDFVSALNCGIAGAVVVDVVSGSGPYNEQVIFPEVLNASSTNTITINGNGNTLVFGASVSTAPSTLELNGTDFLIVNNLNFSGTGTTYAFATHLWNDANNNTFNNCTFTVPGNLSTTTLVPFSISGSVSSATGTGSSGINNVISGCTMNNGYYGTTLVGNSASPSTGNRIENCQINDHYIYGIYLSYQNGAEIKGNTVERPTRTTFSTFYGIYMTTSTTNLLVHGNSIKNPMNASQTSTTAAYGIYAATGSSAGNENRVYNNIVSDFNTNGTQWGIYVYGYFLVYHNTIVLDNSASTAGETRGIYVVSGGTGTNIQNNIITIARGGSGIKHCLYFAVAPSVSNNNVLHMNAPAGTNYIGYRTSSYSTLGTWQSGTGFDANSVDADPLLSAFVPGSGLVNDIGTPVGVLTDFNGASRSLSTPDPGAIEFSLGGLDASISWVSPLSPTNAGLKTITVNIANTQAQTITSLQLSYNDGSGPVIQNFTGLSIAAGNNQNISFVTQYNFTGNVNIDVEILNVNGGADVISGNNTATYYLCLSLGGTYTINSALPTGGTNFQSFNDAITSMSCGITSPVVFNVVAGSGPYDEQVNIPAIAGTSSVNTITFNGNGNTLTNGITTGNYATLNLNGVDYAIFNNLVITASDATTGFAVHLMGGSDNNSFNNCTMNASLTGTGTTTACVSMSGSLTSYSTTGINGSNNTFTGCTLNGGYFGFVAYGDGSNAANNANNSLINCTISNYYVYGAYNYYQSGNTFRGNIFERPTRTTISTFYGVYVSTSRNLLIEKNRIRRGFEGNIASTSTGYGVYLTGDAAIGEEHQIINNVISDMRSAGTIYGIYSTGADYWKAYHNTISLDHTAATGGSTYGVYSSGTLAYDVRNNLISITRGGTGSKWCVYYTSPAAATSNNNNLYMNSAAGTNNIGYNGTSYSTLAAWQSASGKDANSTSENPAYFNPSANNYKPTQSAMDNIGTPLSVTDDIIGALRSPASPDAGAYEFSVAAKDVGVFAFVGPNPDGCYTNAETIVVQIKNYGTQMIDFSVDPVTVNCVITGPVNTTVSATISSGTLMPTATQNVSLSPTINGTANGTYLLNATTVMTSDGEPINDAFPEISLEVGPVAGTVTSSLNTICVSDDPILTAVGVYGGDIQWQESTVSATGPWTNVGTNSATYSPVAVSQTTWYRALTFCNANNASSNVVEIVVNTPIVTSTTPGTRCGIGTVTLSATGSGTTINWYDSPSSQSAMATGSSFTTPVIGTSTTYYVSTSDGGGTASFGLPDRVGATSNSGYSDIGLMFDASVPFTLQSVAVYPIASTPSGNVTATIALKDNAGVILQSTTVSLPTTPLPGVKTLVPLNFIVPAGTQHRLVFTSATGGGITGFIREITSGFTYPYTLPGVASITSAYTSGASSSYYYYFYDWQVVTGCESARVPVVATVTPPPSMTVSANDITLCPGGTTSVNVTSVNDPDYTYSWTSNPSGFTASGAGPHNISPTTSTWYVVTGSDNSSGSNAGCVAIDSVQVFTGATLSAGTVTASQPEICVSGTPTLSVVGSDGGAIQWQESTVSSSGPWTNVGTPSSVYAPGVVTQTTFYRVMVSCQTSDVISNVVTILVNSPVISGTTGATRCGTGSVTLQATTPGTATLKWYDVASGGSALGTGSSFITPVIASSTNFYVSASEGSGGNGTPLLITEIDINDPDRFEIQNVSPNTIDVTGWTVAVSNNYSTFTAVNTNIATLTGTLAPGASISYTDATGGPNYWGSNLLWNPGAFPTFSGWLIILDNAGNIVDFVALNWDATTIATASLVIGPHTVSPGSVWTGAGINISTVPSGQSVSRTGSMDNNSSSDFTIVASTIGTTNTGMTIPFTGFGCESARIPVAATVTPAPVVVVSTDRTLVCDGQSATLTATSSNPDYTYTWNPGSLNGASITVSPSSNTVYTLTAFDNSGNAFDQCQDIQTITINGSTSIPPTPSATSNAPVCEGNPIALFGNNFASGQSSGNTFVWSGPNGFTSISQNPTIPSISPADSGTYIVTVTNQFSCYETASTLVNFNPNPVLNIQSQTDVLCNGEFTGAYTIEVTNGPGFYLYTDGGNVNFDGIFTGIGAGSYNVEVTDGNSCTATIPVTITEPDPTTTADAGTDQTLCGSAASILSGNMAVVGTGSWSVIAGGATVTDPSDPNSTVTGLTSGVNTFRWTIDNALCSNSNFDEVDILINVVPTASISGTTEICNGNSATLTVLFTGTAPFTYSYTNGVSTFGPFVTSNNPENILVSPTATRTYSVTSVSDALCLGTGSGTATVTVTQAPPAGSIGALSAPAIACVGDIATVSCNAVSGATGYTWSGPAGTLFNGQPGPVTTLTNTVSVEFGILTVTSGYNICVQAINACGQSNNKCVWIRGNVSVPAPINGLSVACPLDVKTYSVTPVVGAANYFWTATPQMQIIGGQGTSTITVRFLSPFNSGNICVTAVTSCGSSSTARCMTVSKSTAALGAISGDFVLCPGQTGQVFSIPAVTGAASYTWSVPANVTIVSGQGTPSISVNVGAGFTLGNICVSATSNCGVVSPVKCKTMSTEFPNTPGNITGASSGVCGQTIAYSIPAVSGITNYNWVAPSGASIATGQGTNSVTVTYQSGFTTGQLCVSAINGCGTSTARCVNVKGVPADLGLINGPATVCSFDAGILYSIAPVFGSTGYQWTVPAGATIIAGQGTNAILVDFGIGAGNISVKATNACGQSGTRVLNVIVNCKLTGEIPGVKVNAYPNPVASELTVEVTAETSNTYALEMTDVSGRVVYNGQMNTTGGMKTTTVDVSNLSKGIYMLTVRSNDGFSNQIRIAVQ